jgi:inner membrane protein COX18
MILRATVRRPALLSSRWRTLRNAQSRGFVSETISFLSNGFVDLALASPFAPSLPPYTATIVTLTVLTRVCLILPLSVWVSLPVFVAISKLTSYTQSKKRQWRLEEQVLPRLQTFREAQKAQLSRLSKQSLPALQQAQTNKVFISLAFCCAAGSVILQILTCS